VCVYIVLTYVIFLQQIRETNPDEEHKCTPVFNSVMVKKSRAVLDDDNKR